LFPALEVASAQLVSVAIVVHTIGLAGSHDVQHVWSRQIEPALQLSCTPSVWQGVLPEELLLLVVELLLVVVVLLELLELLLLVVVPAPPVPAPPVPVVVPPPPVPFVGPPPLPPVPLLPPVPPVVPAASWHEAVCDFGSTTQL